MKKEDEVCWQTPEGAAQDTRTAADAIRDFAERHELTHTGGTRIFYTADEWRARGEQYGVNSVLVIVHEGASIGRACSYDEEDYELIAKLSDALEPLGFFVEQCTRWYSAVYHIA